MTTLSSSALVNGVDDESMNKEVASMYIPEFWCGVAATIIVEVAIVAIAAAFDSRKKKK